MIDVIWPSFDAMTSYKGSWDMDFLEDLFDSLGATHYRSFLEAEALDTAFVVIPGQHHYTHMDWLNENVGKLRGVVLCVVGDEESLFDLAQVIHPNIKVWTQSRATSVKDAVSGHLPWGYTREARVHKTRATVKALDWCFSGQVTHDRRKQCVANLADIPNGVLNATPGFSLGYPRDQYHELLSISRIAVCPAGAITPDSFRIWEALEARCIPIVDAASPAPQRCEVANWWPTVLDQQPPFCIVHDWRDLPTIVRRLMVEWELNEAKMHAWWMDYKSVLAGKLRRDYRAVGGRA
jgi:hypothetical protein